MSRGEGRGVAATWEGTEENFKEDISNFPSLFNCHSLLMAALCSLEDCGHESNELSSWSGDAESLLCVYIYSQGEEILSVPHPPRMLWVGHML